MELNTTLTDVYELSEIAKKTIASRNNALLENHKKEVRHFTRAEAMDYLGVSPKTINNHCQKLNINPKRFEDAAWLITIDDVYALRKSMHNAMDNKITFPEFNRTKNQKMQVICVANQKGGTGKTITAATMASCIATYYHEEYRVGIIDADPQGTLSLFYAPDRNHEDFKDHFSFGDLLLGDYELEEGETLKDLVQEAFISTSIPNLRVLPATEDDRQLEGRIHKMILSGRLKNPYNLLDDLLDSVKDEFDIIIIDTPPAMTYSVYNALFAGTSLVVPVSPTENDRDATLSWLTHLPVMFETMNDHGMTPYDNPIKFALTNHDDKKTANDIQAKLNRSFGSRMFDTALKSSEAIRVCAKNVTTIFDISKSEYEPSYKRPFGDATVNAFAFTEQIMKMINETWVKQEEGC